MNDFTTATACVVFLAIASLAATRGRRDPLSLRFAGLCMLLFCYCALDLVTWKRTEAIWDDLDAAVASLAPVAFFDFTVTFLGQRRERRAFTLAFFVYFGGLSLASLSPAVAPGLAGFPGGALWSALMLVGMAPLVALGGAMLVAHARRAAAAERARTALVLAAVLVAAFGTATDLLAKAGAHTPELSPVALVASACLLAAAAIRSKVIDNVSVLVGLNALAVAIGVVLGELALYRFLGGKSAMLAIGSVALALGALLAGRFLLGTVSEQRERTRAHATLGRMSQQMAHDLKNPLAAIRGAAQFLEAELAAGRPLEPHGSFLGLLVEQTDRMARIIDQYQRLGRTEPSLRAIDVNRVVHDATASIGAVEERLAAELPACDADPDLLLIAIENVLRNAREAAGSTGRITISTRAAESGVSIRIEDDGPGMDARTRERAFEDFFTTKATGTGLGLPFVQRVMEAHRGRVVIDSSEGRGTCVTLTLGGPR